MNSVAAVWYEGTYDWNQDWQHRQNLASPGDTARGLFINGLLDAVRTLGGEELVKRCLDACGQDRFVATFSYPITLQMRIISVAMSTLEKRYGAPEGALRQLGRRSALDFMESTAGKMMMRLAGSDPKRLLASLPSAYRVSMSYGEHTLVWTGPRSGRLVMKREFMPHPVHAGVVATLLEAGGAREVRVWGRQTGPLDCECDFSWN
jgi:uncharacterized protein (TIGR02265 family)